MSKSFAVGIDLGGTHVRLALVDEAGRIDRYLKRESRVADGADTPLEAMAEVLAAWSREVDVIGVGIGSPGVIDPATGAQVGTTPHLPHWSDYPLRDRAAARFGRRVEVDNDANLAALGEHRAGAARGARFSLTVTVGTGVGCGIVHEGHVLHGAHGGAGEIGHLPLGDGALACRCGVEACIEPEMSGSGLERLAAAEGLAFRDAAEIFAAAERGDARAREMVERFCDRLALALGTAVNLLNPDIVVLGGGVMVAREELIGRVRQGVERYTLASHRRRLEVVPAQLGERAGVVGAGLMAWDAARRAATVDARSEA